MNRFGTIYKITNLINGKIYVGQTIQSFEMRKSEHLRLAARDGEYAICRAIRKYGKDSFSFDIIEKIEECQLDDHEIFWIKKLNSLSFNGGHGYNMTTGGKGVRGRIQSEEEKAKRSKSMTGLKKSEESKLIMSKKMSGREITWAAKVSEGMTKMLKSNPILRANVIEQAHKAAEQNKKPVEALVNGIWIEFNSRKELAIAIRASASNISKAITDFSLGKITLVKGIQVRPKSVVSDNKLVFKEIG